MKKVWFLALATLGLISLMIWFAVFSYLEGNLKVIACDVGQGDAFLITQKDLQILIDGGPNDKVLRCLSKNMPFWDRVIEVVVLSHPQKDHFAGLIDVFENYEVENLLTTTLDSGSQEWGVLEDLVRGSDTKVLNPVSGDKYRLGLIYLDILFPSGEYLSASLDNYELGNSGGVLGAHSSKKDPNEFSLVLILSYKDFNALFTGDINPAISDVVAGEVIKEEFGRLEYIKVPHHGSKNGLTQVLLDAAKPEIAVIPVGKNNFYGHPHKGILDMLQSTGVQILRTDELGQVIVESDGGKCWFNN